MYVGMAKITLVIAHAHSLKEKRMVLRRIKDRVRERVSVTVNEVGDQDVWQRAELGCAVASGERTKAVELLDDVIRCIAAECEIAGVAKDVITFDAMPELALREEAAGEDPWIPDAWREEAK